MDILKVVVGVLVRWALGALFGILIERHLLTDVQGAEAVAKLTAYAVPVALGAITIGLSLVQKYRSHSKLLMALQLPAGSSLDELKTAMAEPPSEPVSH